MTTVNDKELEDLLARCFAGLPKATEQVGCAEAVNVTSANCKQAMKPTLVALFTEAFHLVRFQADKMKQMKAELSSTKSQLIENQKWVISLQEQIIDGKDSQLEAVKTVVETSVDNTVIPRYNAPRYNADLAITRFFTPKVFLPHLLRKGKFSAKLVNISL